MSADDSSAQALVSSGGRTRPPRRPWLSILLPAYNVAPYVRDCAESILTQADEGIEILLADDASTDSTTTVLRQLRDEHPGRLEVLHNPQNIGLSATRNRLLETARGEYIWFLDSDDRLAPGAIKALQKIIEQRGPDLVLFDYQMIGSRMRWRHYLRNESHKTAYRGPARCLITSRDVLLTGIFRRGKMFAWCRVSRRDLWKQDLRFPEGRYFEDSCTTPILAARAASTWYEPSPWVQYRRHEHSILATLSANKIDDLVLAIPTVRGMMESDSIGLASRTRFEWTASDSNIFVQAARFADKMENGGERMVDYRRAFLNQLPLSLGRFRLGMVIRGRLWRWARFEYWLWRSRPITLNQRSAGNIR